MAYSLPDSRPQSPPSHHHYPRLTGRCKIPPRKGRKRRGESREGRGRERRRKRRIGEEKGEEADDC